MQQNIIHREYKMLASNYQKNTKPMSD